jgi:hypothetical protein
MPDAAVDFFPNLLSAAGLEVTIFTLDSRPFLKKQGAYAPAHWVVMRLATG